MCERLFLVILRREGRGGKRREGYGGEEGRRRREVEEVKEEQKVCKKDHEVGLRKEGKREFEAEDVKGWRDANLLMQR